MLERLLQLFVVCFLGLAFGRPQLDVLVTDERQATMLKDALEHHIVVPYAVDSNGNFLSHNLHHYRTKRNVETKQIHYHVPFKNKHLHLSLTPNDDFMAPGLGIEWMSGRITQPKRNCHFIGTIKNSSRSSVAVSNCKGLAGLIRAHDDREYFIEPVLGADLDEHNGRHPHVMYRRSTVQKSEKNNTEPPCGVTVEDVHLRPDPEELEKQSREEKGFYLKRKQRSVSLMKHIEALLVADYTMTEYYTRQELETYLFTIINMLTLVFKHRSIGSAINVVVVRVMILDKKHGNGLNVTSHARNTLNDFCSWVKKINPPSDQDPLHADAAILVTRKNICRHSYRPCETVGLSNIDGMCSPGKACSYNEDTGFPLVYTIAHELGHNLGMLHDSDYSSCANIRDRIMSDTLVEHGTHHSWSKCSRKAVKSFFYKGWGWCLNDRPGGNVVPKEPRKLPGQVISAQLQCKMLFGTNSTLCLGTAELATICQSLWCDYRFTGTCATMSSGKSSVVPALDGTPCGKTKWCHRGRCRRRTVLRQPVDGNWSPWSSWSACSKSCGRGVRRKLRKCNSPRPDNGGFYCVGEWKRFSICNTQPCPEGSASAIAIQCNKFRSLLINGKRYEWSARQYQKNPCEIRCAPQVKKGRSRMRKFLQAQDGTPCNHGTINICVQGKCEHVGCDNKLYSNAREDKCGVCRGDGTSCETKYQIFNKTRGEGYTEAMVIPAGARNIVINEVSGSPSFLALRSAKGDYFLNGNWYIRWQGRYKAAGVYGFYTRRHNRETFKTKGPIKEDLHVVLLYQAYNSGLKVQYDVKRNGSIRAPVFHWQYGNWSACSATCGKGFQKRTAECVDEERNIIDNQHCKGKIRFAKRYCNLKNCPPSWWIGLWQECSKTCGVALRFRPVLCTQLVEDRREVIAEPKCTEKKPEKSMKCQNPLCWVTYHWSNCSSSCGPGIQTRLVQCPGNISNCDISTKPPRNRTCFGGSCSQWVVGPWGECSVTCGNGSKSRMVACAEPDESKCNRLIKPETHQACPGFRCPLWRAGNWSECSVTCGKGIQFRNVTCQHAHSKFTCNESKRPEFLRACLEKRCSGWITGEWGTCSASCGEGIRERKVVCTFKSCTAQTRPAHKEPCKLRDCPKWLVGEWSDCSATCGKGKQHRNVTCSESNSLCPEEMKPTPVKHCEFSECSLWNLGDWTECSVSCGIGVQTRSIVCNAASQSLCEVNMPQTERPCHKVPCIQWKTSNWSQCSTTCGTGVQTRRIWCDGISCDLLNKPNSTQPCYRDDCAIWVTGNWEDCSVACGEGVQTRQVYCSHDDEFECNSDEMPESTQDCFVSNCSGWIVTPWMPCSAKCGMGLTSRKAVCSLPNPKSCPHKPRVRKLCFQAPCSKWSTGQWSVCSATCGVGVQRRIVSCNRGRCLASKKPNSTRTCKKPSCPSWITGNWSECSVSCGYGFQVRNVSCDMKKSKSCDEDNRPAVKKPCNISACPYWLVGSWSNCSSSCGEGIQTRNVTCVAQTIISCQNVTRPSLTKICFSGQCPKWVVSNWTSCSVTCGQGVQERFVYCLGEWGENRSDCLAQGKPPRTQRCGETPCPQWITGQWSKCSKTCGGGVQSRSVTCKNNHVGICLEKDRPENNRKCDEALCPEWSVGKWNKCSKTCGGGTQSRSVMCKNSQVGKCAEKDKPEVTKECGKAPCPEWSVGKWNKCSKTCGGGIQSRSVICQNTHVGKCPEKYKPVVTKKCGEASCPEWSVGRWSKCSKTCGVGLQTRNVTCKNSHVGRCSEKDKPDETIKCGEAPCPIWITGKWSKCSKTCGGGTQTRSIACRYSRFGQCPEDTPNTVRKCGEASCPKWSVGRWSKCSKTCGGGTQSRTVTCKYSHVGNCSEESKPNVTKICAEAPCPEWSTGGWTKCSTTCGSGIQSRTVICKNSHAGSCSDKNKPIKNRKCGIVPCPEWSVGQWGKCSKTCGGGIQSRTVTCKNSHVGNCSEKSKPGVTKICAEAPCPEWSASGWTKCSKTCGSGTQSRTVICKNSHVGNCPEKDKPSFTKKCGEALCPKWSVGFWGKCSKTCGGGTQFRSVTCENSRFGKCLEKDKPKFTRNCGEAPCPEWSVGQWSKCSKTCGSGTQLRRVVCKNSYVGKCIEKSKPQVNRKCGDAPCPEWSVGQWNECSRSCGGGTQSRTVECRNRNVGKCPEKDKPDLRKKCGDVPCPKWLTGEWSKCSKTCGGGTQSRAVFCKNSHVGKCPEKSKPDITRKCGDVPCPKWSTGEWNKCSKTCGGGTQARSVVCKNSNVGKCAEKSKPDMTKKCDEQPCPEWSTGEWNKCSRTCGGGTQSRSVVCKNSNVGKCAEKSKPDMTKKCGEAPCPEWSADKWSICSKTCGGGTQSRKVVCKNSNIGKCPKKSKPDLVKKCGDVPCPEWSTGEWNECSKSCGGGTKSRTVVCKNSRVGKCPEKSKPDITRKCGDVPCPKWSTGEWSTCSKSCGGGTQSRSVVCKNSNVGKCTEKPKPDKNRKCGELPCPKWSTGEWNKCSKTCGGGTQARSVVCKNSNVGKCAEKSKPDMTKKCDEQPCPEWSTGEWNKCSRTCGGGTQSRSVVCKNSNVGKCAEKSKPDMTKKCGEAPCPEWSADKWSICSKTCGGGTQSRKVVCKNSNIGKCPKKSKPDLVKKCGDVPCPEWSTGEWNECSKSCGGGTKSRTVVCKNSRVGKCPEKSKPDIARKCGDVPCPKWSTGEWSTCSKSCGGGTQSRSVVCKNSNVGKCTEKPKPDKNRKCGELPCPKWSTGEWNKCSKTCGGGTQARSVVCKNSNVGKCAEKSKPDMTKKCDEQPCPEWSTGEWNKCSRTCGGGTQSRSVVCKNSNVGKCAEKSKPDMTKKCGEAPCPEWSADKWSICSKTCGGGTQSRKVVCKNSNIGKCPKKSKPDVVKKCGEAPCPEWSAGGWSQCSKTCDGGTQSRSIVCKNSQIGICPEKSKPAKSRKCGNVPCPEWSTGEWNECSKSCGGGTKSRTVVCKNSRVGKCPEKSKPDITKKCGDVPCPKWSTGEWSTCSKSCGGGTQSRSVVCKNSNVGKCTEKSKPDKNRKCGELPCPKWSTGEWNKCSKTCGGGTQSRTVVCKNNQVGKCLKNDKPDDTKKCGQLLCPEWSTGEWSKCSKTCGGGTQMRSVVCKNNQVGKCLGNVKPDVTKKCGQLPCPEWSTGKWSKCSKTCGGGKQTRIVTCSNSRVGECLNRYKPVATRKCRNDPCPVWAVGKWNKCSKSCGSGIRVRKVWCSGSGLCDGRKPLDRERCYEQPCPKWIVGEWTTCVSRKCGQGKRFRSVICSEKNRRKCNRKEKPASRQPCKVECAKWQTSEWSKCSGTCSLGKMIRRVWCEGGNRICRLSKKPRVTKLCTPDHCFEWKVGPWGSCPVTCGGGIRGRSVRCINKATGKPNQGCERNIKPAAIQSCALTECPPDPGKQKSTSRGNCRQAKHDTFFCNLLIKPSLSELCLYKQWRKRCCRTCLRVNAQRRHLK